MRGLRTRWDSPNSRFGNVAVLSFLLAQFLDGALTYVGVKTWGLSIEANPLISSTVHAVGLGPGLAAMKLLAGTLGIALHLRSVHVLVAVLTALYVAVAIVPWTALFLAN
jgi:uncharacterized membrane protein